MKNTTYSFSLFFFLVVTLLSCDVEKLDNIESAKKKVKANFVVTQSDQGIIEGADEHCKTVNLIAGQNHIAGTVTVDVEGDNLIITYTTNGEWTLDVTHLSITNCEEGGFPSTNSGNPKIGNFEYSSSHDDGTTEVVYTIPLEDVSDEFCFAAHAEVSGPTQETAWAEGSGFGGNNWAMFVEATLSECEDDTGGGGGIG